MNEKRTEDNLIAPNRLITPGEAAQLKEVSRAAIYKALAEGRLPSERVLGRLALNLSDVLAWSPQKHGGRRHNAAMSDGAKAKLSASQKKRWDQRKEQT